MTTQIAPHVWLPEPKLAFHIERPSDNEIHPLRGLLNFGPYSGGLVPDPIRIATLAPSGEGDKLRAFLNRLNLAHSPSSPSED